MADAVSSGIVGGLTSAQTQELKRLRSTHPTYDALKEDWCTYLASYVGGKSFAHGDNLFKHSRETDNDFKNRCKRVHYVNVIGPLVDYYTDFIYSETIQRDGGTLKEFYTDFVKNVDREGKDITSFMRPVAAEMQIFGTDYILVDAPPKPEGTVTKEDEKVLAIRPYWVRVRPLEVLDWVKNERGEYDYWKRCYCLSKIQGGAKLYIERYEEWTPDAIYVTEVDVTDKEKPKLGAKQTIDNAIGKVTVVPVHYKESLLYSDVGDSFCTNLTPQAKECMNLTSLLQEFLYKQCFNMLAMESEDTEMQEQEKTPSTIGTNNVVEVPKGASHMPAYISPAIDPAEFLQSEREKIWNAMYAIAAQDTVKELSNGVKASGMSKSMSFSKTVPKIACRADILEAAEMKAMQYTVMYLGGSKTWDGAVKYKDHYDVTNLTDAITQLTSLFRDLGMPSKTFALTELKKMIHQFDGKFSADELAKIEAELEAAFADDAKFQKWLDKIFTEVKPSPAAQNGSKETGTKQEHVSEGRNPGSQSVKLRAARNTK